MHSEKADQADTTALQKLIDQLTVRNASLERANQELESFAYVASHDLQEPLRKIHIFSNRILEKDGDNFSADSKDYFNRVVSAATRMQRLIDALLNYSRTNTDQKIFVRQHLNKVLGEVKHNLQVAIEEKNALIESGDLPVLNVIPHQFIQLMENILSNSLKYSRPDVQPVIKFSAALVQSAASEHNDARKDFWRISIEDNGIGFDNQYRDKIFDLFQRLHGIHEYEGTGIGLAICKKIVENHGGTIEADGNPGNGAVFHIYLPVQAETGDVV